ncbi:MAG: hypothetical protein Q8932_18980, partial [Bacteroidota bacterium]|nr:hypothetical protein [Bacteroidota bacterium]
MAQDVHEIDKNLNNFRLESAVLWHDKNSQFSKPYIDLLFGSTNSMLVETEYMKTSALEEMETDSTEPIFSEFNRLYDSITLYRTNRDSLKLLGILQYYAQYLDSHGSSLKTMTAYYRDRQLTKLKFRKRWF